MLGIICLLTLALTACKPPPHSSPTALRNTNDYAKAVAPVAPRALDLQALDNIDVAPEGDELVVTIPRLRFDEAGDGFEHGVKYLKAGEKLEGAEASFEVVAIAGSGPGISKTATNQDKTVPLEYFGIDGRRLGADELKGLGFKDWELREAHIGTSGGVDDAFPRLRISLGSVKAPPGYYSFVGLFDARTKKSLVSGWSSSDVVKDHLGHVNVHPHGWHATPMEAVQDVELDGKAVVETNAVAGMRMAVPGGEVRLLGIWDGSAHSWSSQSGSANGPSIVRLDLRERDGEKTAVALFVTEPPKLAVHIDLLDGKGGAVPGAGGGTSGGIRLLGVRGRAADVKQVRFSVYTNHYRVVCELPPIPNLPAARQPVENLFEVPIPQVQIQREYELRELIGEMTEMKFVCPPGGDTMPTTIFPLAFTNITPAQLLVEYGGYVTNGYGVVVDEKKNEIRVEPTQFEKIKRWVRQKLP